MTTYRNFTNMDYEAPTLEALLDKVVAAQLDTESYYRPRAIVCELDDGELAIPEIIANAFHSAVENTVAAYREAA